MNNNEMLVVNEENYVRRLTGTDDCFTSLKATTTEEKIHLYNAMNNPDKKLGDCVNEIIKAKDLYCEEVECVNEETGEVTIAPRVVIVDDKGISYQCVSVGVWSAIKRLIAIFGVPTWDEPIALKVKSINKDKKRLLTLEAVMHK